MKLSKVLSIVMLAVMLITMASNIVLATDPSTITITPPTDGKITTLGGKIIGVIQTVGSGIAVAILVVLGIKYMMGSTEEKAEYKKTLIPYVIGAILIFAASNIAGVVYNMAQGIK